MELGVYLDMSIEAEELLVEFKKAFTGDENARMRLVKAFLEDIDEAMNIFARRVGGDIAPDTVVVRTAAEIVIAALAYSRRKLRIVMPSEPFPGWKPLLGLVEALSARRMVEVYRVPMQPSSRLPASMLARRVARVAKGFSAKVVDVSDAPPTAVAGLYGAGVRILTVLVDLGYVYVFQKFSYT